jgi:hypothetical protein
MKSTVRMLSARILGAVLLGVVASCSTPTTPAAVAPAGGVARSYIVEAATTDAAATAVTAAGGEVVSRLGVIDAVEATLTEAQFARVQDSAGVKQVTANAQVTTQAAANVRDNFETGSFSNNDGSHRWWGDWVEANDNNSP